MRLGIARPWLQARADAGLVPGSQGSPLGSWLLRDQEHLTPPPVALAAPHCPSPAPRAELYAHGGNTPACLFFVFQGQLRALSLDAALAGWLPTSSHTHPQSDVLPEEDLHPLETGIREESGFVSISSRGLRFESQMSAGAVSDEETLHKRGGPPPLCWGPTICHVLSWPFSTAGRAPLALDARGDGVRKGLMPQR